MNKQFQLQLVNVKTQKVIKNFDISTPGKYIIGRSAQADIQIQHETLSRKHAEITVLQNSATLKDLESANGTFIAEKQVGPNQQILLKKDLCIYFGECEDKIVVVEIQQSIEEESKEESENEVDNKQENKNKKKKSKKSKSKNEDSDDSSDEKGEKILKKQKKADKKSLKEKLSRSRSRSKSQEKQSQNQEKDSVEKIIEQRKQSQGNLSMNKQFGKEKANIKSVFGNKSNDVESKRKLLWGSKEKNEIPKEKQIWNNLSGEGTDKIKFMKLLGVKNVEEYSQQEKKPDTFIIKSAADVKVDKYQQINDNLERQFYQGNNRKFQGNRGLGN